MHISALETRGFEHSGIEVRDSCELPQLVLGTELKSSRRAVGAINGHATSLVLQQLCFKTENYNVTYTHT